MAEPTPDDTKKAETRAKNVTAKVWDMLHPKEGEEHLSPLIEQKKATLEAIKKKLAAQEQYKDPKKLTEKMKSVEQEYDKKVIEAAIKATSGEMDENAASDYRKDDPKQVQQREGIRGMVDSAINGLLEMILPGGFITRLIGSVPMFKNLTSKLSNMVLERTGNNNPKAATEASAAAVANSFSEDMSEITVEGQAVTFDYTTRKSVFRGLRDTNFDDPEFDKKNPDRTPKDGQPYPYVVKDAPASPQPPTPAPAPAPVTERTSQQALAEFAKGNPGMVITGRLLEPDGGAKVPAPIKEILKTLPTEMLDQMKADRTKTLVVVTEGDKTAVYLMQGANGKAEMTVEKQVLLQGNSWGKPTTPNDPIKVEGTMEGSTLPVRIEGNNLNKLKEQVSKLFAALTGLDRDPVATNIKPTNGLGFDKKDGFPPAPLGPDASPSTTERTFS